MVDPAIIVLTIALVILFVITLGWLTIVSRHK